MFDRYDAIVIGGGVAGCETAKLLSIRGKHVLLIEKDVIGGVCLNSGCIPSKYYLSQVHCISKGTIMDKGVFLKDIKRKKDHIVSELRKGMTQELLSSGVEIVYDEVCDVVFSDDKYKVTNRSGKEYQSDMVFLATGTKTDLLWLSDLEEQIDNGFVGTNEQLFELEEFPETIAIIGGGTSGVEMTDFFSLIGSKVILLEKGDRILQQMEEDVSRTLTRKFLDRNVEIYTRVNIKAICEGTIVFEIHGETRSLDCDYVYLASGRKACFDIKDIGTKESNRLYFVGDTAGGKGVAYKALRDAEMVVNRAVDERILEYGLIPELLFTKPECASVGLCNIDACKMAKYKEQRLSMNYSGRYVAQSGGLSERGFIKLIFDTDNVIVGGVLCSYYATEIVGLIQLMIERRMTCYDIINRTYAHPTEYEMIKRCAQEFVANMVS